MTSRLPETPLSLAIRDERVNRLVHQVRHCLDRGEPLESLVIALTPNEIREIQLAFHEALRRGEHTLYGFVQSLAETWFPGIPLSIEARVLARPRRGPRQIAWIQRRLQRDELLRYSDSALATRITREITGGRDTLVIAASSIHFFPEGSPPPASKVCEFITRVKATEDICSKITDEIFRISEALRRDKITNRLSRYLKDLYGVKVVCGTTGDCYEVRQEIEERSDLSCIEVKDYIARPKSSGFQALKMVVVSRGLPIEVQVLSREMRQRETAFPETSHRTYKEKREKLRSRLGPEYARCYQFLREVFRSPEEPPLPRSAGVEEE